MFCIICGLASKHLGLTAPLKPVKKKKKTEKTKCCTIYSVIYFSLYYIRVVIRQPMFSQNTAPSSAENPYGRSQVRVEWSQVKPCRCYYFGQFKGKVTPVPCNKTWTVNLTLYLDVAALNSVTSLSWPQW